MTHHATHARTPKYAAIMTQSSAVMCDSAMESNPLLPFMNTLTQQRTFNHIARPLGYPDGDGGRDIDAARCQCGCSPPYGDGGASRRPRVTRAPGRPDFHPERKRDLPGAQR